MHIICKTRAINLKMNSNMNVKRASYRTVIIKAISCPQKIVFTKYFVSGCTVPQHQHFLQLQPRRHVFQLRQEPCCDVKLQMQQRLMVPRTGLDCAGRAWFQPVLGRSQEARCPRMPCSAGNSSHLKKS